MLLQVLEHHFQSAKLNEQNPALYKQFINIVNKLENHYKDMQDMEFTIEEGKVILLTN